MAWAAEPPIDAFDETTGTLFDDTFVSVAPDDGTFATSGNVEGYVDTTKSETITALSPTSPTGVDFSRWVLLVPSSATASGAALAVPQGGSPLALGFYRAPVPAPCATAVAGLQQVINDCGPALPIFLFQGLKLQLQQCVIEGYVMQSVVTTLENEYMNLWTDCHPRLPRHL